MIENPETPRGPAGEAARQLELEFARLYTLGQAERAARLDELARTAPHIVPELVSLLDESDEMSGFLGGSLEENHLSALLHAGQPEPPAVPGYSVTEELGHGSMGVVWKAEQRRPRRTVAIKVLRWDVAGPALRERFLQEAELLGRLQHPACARVIEAGVLEGPRGGPWIAMEFVEGDKLGAVLSTLDRDEILRLFARLAEGVHAAHCAGVIHRDLKPDNILVRPDGNPVILDFGIARLLTDEARPFQTQTGLIIGTPAYMSPEQARGASNELDARSDVYALGTLLYEALCGELPVAVRGTSAIEALRRVEAANIPPLGDRVRDLPRDVELVVHKALQPEPDRRYSSARALALDLSALLEGRPVAARPPSLGYQALRFARRNRALSAAVAATVLSLGAALAITLVSLAQAREHGALHAVAELEGEVEKLWPATSAKLPEIEALLASARRLGRILEARVDRFIANPDQTPVEERPPTERARDFFRGSSTFMGLKALEQRREIARQNHEATVLDHAEAWQSAARRVASDPRFEGLALAPIEGLIPLGPDPRSHLEEFGVWHWTGPLPERDARTRELIPSDRTAIVLVLIPGGRYTIGSQRDDENAPYYSEDTRPHCPLREVELEPFLIGKYEVTQGQWIQAMGFNPSYWSVGKEHKGAKVDARFAVESVTHDQALAFTARLGLTLPTEAQFEVANRAGTTTRYFTGYEFESLKHHAIALHLKEPRDYRDVRGLLHWKEVSFFSPVGIYEPNPWGLHDTIGNVQEWCRDVYWTIVPTKARHRAGDGLLVYADQLPEPENTSRSIRGGEKASSPHSFNCGNRGDASANSVSPALGFRVSLDLRPNGS